MAKTAVLNQPIERSVLSRVQEMLGVRELPSEDDLVKLVEDRLPLDAIDSLQRGGFTDREIYALVVPRRTLTHRRTRKERLSVDESDRAVRIARIAALGEHVFGEPARAWRYLRAPKRMFKGRSPLQVIETEAGARLVEELLYKIDDGMAA